MHWQRLDRDDTLKAINSVQSDENAGLISPTSSEVQRARVSFYKDHYIYKITSFASLPSFSFQFLSDGTFFHYLDGTEAPIHTVNDKGALILEMNTVSDYLTFYFSQVEFEDGDVTVITNPHDMPLLDSLGPAAYDAVFNHHQAPTINYDGGFDRFEIETDLYLESHMVRAKIYVTSKGRVDIIEQKSNMHQVMKTPGAEQFM